ncbi:MAG: FtsB family cell division protein [Hyphomicrobiales bacterium]
MVVKRRFRGFGFFIALYVASFGASAFFILEAQNGSRGVERNVLIQADVRRLETELETVRRQRSEIERRNAQLSIQSLDADFLDERARAVLNVANSNEVVIPLP